MPSYGYFNNDRFPHRPIVVATIKHDCLRYPRQVEFLVDTGACRTFIAPEWQKNILCIPDNKLVPYPDRVTTIMGDVPVDCLTSAVSKKLV